MGRTENIATFEEPKNYDVKLVRADYERLTKTLIEKQITISTMESATSGQIASLITDTEGASAVFRGAFVAYSNEIKEQLGVPAEIIDTYSVYSKETAIAMAKLCKNEFHTNIGIGVTGTMGNVDPANKDASEPGKVYFAVDFNENILAYQLDIPVQASRSMYKTAVAKEIVDVVLEYLEK